MGIIVKLFKHTPIYSILLVCLLAVGIAFSSIGFSFYQSARQQQAEVYGSYTTAAIPFNEEAPGFMPVETGKFKWEAVSLEQLLQDAPVRYKLDRRVCLGAVVADMASWTPAANMLSYTPEADCPYAASVFAVRCDSVQTDAEESYAETYDQDGNLLSTEAITSTRYHGSFSVLETICFMDRGVSMPEFVDPETGSSHSVGLPPELLEIDTELVNRDGTPAFEEGKTYLIRGDCTLNTSGTKTGYFFLRNGAASTGMEECIVDGRRSMVLSEETLPLYTEFTGSVDDFLASEEGNLWRDTIIPAVEQNYHAAKLMLSDNVSSMYWFNTGEASILEGRLFTDDEYQTGQAVCLVSADYAERNGLSVGDTLTMELFHPRIDSMRSGGGETDATCMLIDPCLPNNSLELQKIYTIVGIYTAPALASGAYAFGPDTILAPKASVPGAADFEDDGTYIPLLNSAMIPNGTQEKLNAFLEEKGFGGSLLFFDQGYTQASSAVSALMSNALRLFVAGSAFWAITTGLFLFLCLYKMGPTMRSLRRMGVSSKTCWHEIQAAMLPMVLGAVLLGAAFSVLSFQQVGQMLLSVQMDLPFGTILVDAVSKLVILLLLEGLCAWHLTKANLMQKGKRGKTA